MQHPQDIRSRSLAEIASPHLKQVPDRIFRARASASKIAGHIEVLHRRRAKLERKLQQARRDKRAAVEDEAMKLELLLHDLEEEKAWWDERSTLPRMDGDSFDVLRLAFERLMPSERIWDVTAENVGQQYRSLATSAIARKPVNLGFRLLERLDPQQKALHFRNANGADLYIFPQVLVVHEAHQGFALIDLKDVRLEHSVTQFFEEEQVPSDTRTVGHTWRYTNKDGSPDRRFRGNYQIPIVLYGQLDFITSSGLHERYLISDPVNAETFGRAFSIYQGMVEPFPVAQLEEVDTPSQVVLERQRLIEQRLPLLPKRKSRQGLVLRQAYSDGFCAARLPADFVPKSCRSYGYDAIRRLVSNQTRSRIDPSFQA